MIYEAAWAGSRWVRVLPAGKLPETRNVRGSMFCDIAVTVDERTGLPDYHQRHRQSVPGSFRSGRGQRQSDELSARGRRPQSRAVDGLALKTKHMFWRGRACLMFGPGPASFLFTKYVCYAVRISY